MDSIPKIFFRCNFFKVYAFFPQNSNNADLFLRQMCPFDVHQVYYRLNWNTEPLRSLLLRACQHLSSNWIDLQGCREMDLEIPQRNRIVVMTCINDLFNWMFHFVFLYHALLMKLTINKQEHIPLTRSSCVWGGSKLQMLRLEDCCAFKPDVNQSSLVYHRDDISSLQ